jgi:hypothetical protein
VVPKAGMFFLPAAYGVTDATLQLGCSCCVRVARSVVRLIQ